MHTRFFKYRDFIFVVLMTVYVFSAFQYASVKLLYTMSYFAELNSMYHQENHRAGHSHKLIKKVDLVNQTKSSDNAQLIIEIVDKFERITCSDFIYNPYNKSFSPDIFHYSKLKPLCALKVLVPPPRLLG